MKNLIILASLLCTSQNVIADGVVPTLLPPINFESVTTSKTCGSLADIIEPLMPAVVNVYTSKNIKKSDVSPMTPFMDNFPFEKFGDLFEQFNYQFNQEETYSDPKASALGSGFIIDPTGLIVTNHHVINNADEINIKLPDNTELPAKLIGSDPKTDLALLKVEPKQPLPFVKFGDSGKARVGDQVIAIGNPFGLGGTVTTGIVSSKGRDLYLDTDGIVDNFIQTDAAINSGNSGGPMFNIAGEVVGINTAIFSPSGTNVGIGFAIPSNTAQAIIEQLQKTGKISRGRLDIAIQEVTPELAEGLGLKEAMGALVVNVQAGGSGDKSGIKAGDVIIEFAGQSVKNSRRLQVLVAESPINKDLKALVIRNGKNKELIVKIIDNNNSSELSKSAHNSSNSLEKNGIIFSNINDEFRRKFDIKGINEGVIISNIAKTSKSYGLKQGDVIIAANQQNINNIDQLSKIYTDSKTANRQNLVLLIKRRNIDLFIAIPIIK